MPRKIEISHRTIVFTVFFLIFLWLLYLIKEVILQIFVALLIMTILNPTVCKLHRNLKMPRTVAVVFVYLVVFGILTSFFALLVPPLIEQTGSFANSIPKYVEELKVPEFVAQGISNEATSQLARLPSQLIKMSIAIFSNVLAIFSVFIFALYFLIFRERLDEQLSAFFKNEKNEKKIERVIDKLELRLGGWARGQIVLMVVVGLAHYIGFVIIGLPFAVPLALLAGLFEIVPNIGPVIAALPAIIVAFGVSPVTALAVATLSVLIQQLENYVLVPKVMEKSVGVNPIITLLSLVIGLKLAGVVGALLSVPVVITLHVFFDEFLFNKN